MSHKYIHKAISLGVASRIIKNLSGRMENGESITFETDSFSQGGKWFSSAVFKFRIDDGSAWSLMGHGKVRKMVTIQKDNSNESLASSRKVDLFIVICG